MVHRTQPTPMLPQIFPPWRDSWTLHEDPEILVVNKPAGVSTHSPDDKQRDDAVSRIQRWLLARGHLTEASRYLGIHQRLDRDTSGVLVFARSKTANKGLAEQFEGRHVKKTYLAVVRSLKPLPEQGVLTHDLVPGEGGSMKALVPSPRPPPKAQRAVTRYRVISQHNGKALLEVSPETGRTHQIRVQLAAIGCPIVGDVVYGGDASLRLMLHASSLTLKHPTRGERVTYDAPTPDGFATTPTHEEKNLGGWPQLLSNATDRRYGIVSDGGTTAFRLVHTGDGSAAHVDVYNRHALVHFYTPEGDEALLDAVMAMGFEGVYVKFRPKQANTLVDTRREALAPAHAVRGTDAPDEFTVQEHGMTLLARLGDGLSTGVFLDQRENRRKLREISKAKSVLNLFAYTCPFTVAAALGGASRTVSVDVSQSALEWGRRNLEANGVDGPQHTRVATDVFGWLEGARARKERFDVIVLDPPSYSTTKGSRFSAESDYKRLAAATFAVLAPGGTLLACTNHRGILKGKFRRWLYESARDAGRELTKLRDLPEPEDFPPEPGTEPHLKSALATL
jgi:23S rRNA (cytosine1962-C5)-methyltransferase